MHFARRVKKSNSEHERRIDELERKNAALKEQLNRRTTPGRSGFIQTDPDIYFLFFIRLKTSSGYWMKREILFL